MNVGPDLIRIPVKFFPSQRMSPGGQALFRLSVLGVSGCVVVVIFGLSVGQNKISAISAGLMAGGATFVAGVLLGFIFGVPFTREGGSVAPKTDGKISTEAEGSSQSVQPTYYRPNTSLEQISDWLAKMLVGVGLVEIKNIPPKLKYLALYISKGLGGGEKAATFAFTVLIYFSVCGFLFGFLWARIYLRRWFTEADEDLVRNIVDEKLSRIEADAKALR